jgi:hypothetical protein
MSDHADFNEEARRILQEATASSVRLMAESRKIKAATDARLLDSLIVMFRSDALVCASKIEQRGRKLDEMLRYLLPSAAVKMTPARRNFAATGSSDCRNRKKQNSARNS